MDDLRRLKMILRNCLRNHEKLYFNEYGVVRICNEVTGTNTDYCVYQGCVLNLTTWLIPALLDT